MIILKRNEGWNNLCLIRIGRAEFVGEFQLSVKRLCFCLLIHNECKYIRLISI